MEINVVSRTSILLGAESDIEGLVPQLLSGQLVSNWQKLYPTLPNTARILIVVPGVEQDYQKALAAVISAAAKVKVAWRHEDFATYGDPSKQIWIPPLQ
jgi:hypothetical protein